MLKIYRSTHYRPSIKQRTAIQPGSWIRCEAPTADEKDQLIELGVDQDVLMDALDPHEIPRIEVEEDTVYFITRLPDTDDNFNDFTTPILFAIGRENMITISRDNLDRLWNPFIDRVLTPTTQKNRTFLHMVDAISKQYHQRVTSINRQMRATTSNIHRLGSKDIEVLAGFERRLNDYLDALQPTNTAIETLLRGNIIKLYEDDRDLVEDLSVDLEQLIARCVSLLRTITNSRDSYRAVMDTKLNETIRLLTVMTVILAIPTMFAGLYGMNVDLPFQSAPWAFNLILVISLIIGLLLGYYFLRKR